VPITPFLDGEAAFDPETIEIMSKALIAACQALGLKEKDDAANRLLAMRIIDMARDGVRDPILLTAAATKGFRRAGSQQAASVGGPSPRTPE
jgi:hypothetical protein